MRSYGSTSMGRAPSARHAHVGLVLGCLLCLSACDGSPEVRGSGFIADYYRLGPDHDGQLDRVYQQPDHVLARYTRFVVQPVVLHFAPSAEGGAIDPAKLEELMTYFDAYLVERLGAKYELVDRAGPGTARLRVALTDVKLGKTLLNALPPGRLSGAGLGGAAFEAEMLDSQTGNRLAAVVDSGGGERLSLEGLDPLDNAKQVFRFWIDDLVRRIDRAQLSRRD